ncbi:hypothetical protein F7725_024447 [Dissostichus mawsoni]|uniref:Uncharacterized protein n=1 Tax=Dissostichus mawsoni TaxID=36200 RepID=A0A7J5XZF1_DISMA|nr:hypothetical protein F7725_024447 [Dissostichus mawsoni]
MVKTQAHDEDMMKTKANGEDMMKTQTHECTQQMQTVKPNPSHPAPSIYYRPRATLRLRARLSKWPSVVTRNGSSVSWQHFDSLVDRFGSSRATFFTLDICVGFVLAF